MYKNQIKIKVPDSKIRGLCVNILNTSNTSLYKDKNIKSVWCVKNLKEANWAAIIEKYNGGVRCTDHGYNHKYCTHLKILKAHLHQSIPDENEHDPDDQDLDTQDTILKCLGEKNKGIYKPPQVEKEIHIKHDPIPTPKPVPRNLIHAHLEELKVHFRT